MTTQLNADLVVVGAGGAGLPAALVAQQEGLANVVVLEKRSVLGGNAGMSGGYLFALNSDPQRRQGISNSPDEVFRGTMSYYHYDGVDPRLIRLWVDEADRNVNWLESLGVQYRTWVIGATDLVVEPAGGRNDPGSFKRVIDVLADHFVARGGQILAKTAATGILPDHENGLHRVLATGRDGDLEISTPRVLLASGGFTGNTELLNEKFAGVYDEEIYWTDAKRLAGDGIVLADQAGGDTSGRTFLIKENCYSFKTKKNKPNRGAQGSPLWVNRRGERFLDESLGTVNAGTNALIAQPEMTGFALFDEAILQDIVDHPPFLDDLPEEDKADAPAFGGFRDLREEFAAPENAEWSIRADSWEEVAEWIGADPAVLRASVEEHNAFVEAGRDALWAKPERLLHPLTTAPFYALRFRPLMVDTSGPVRVDRELQVLDTDGTPVPGVFAAGALVSGWIGNDEHRFGTPLSWAIASGRIAGEHAARYAPRPADLAASAG